MYAQVTEGVVVIESEEETLDVICISCDMSFKFMTGVVQFRFGK